MPRESLLKKAKRHLSSNKIVEGALAYLKATENLLNLQDEIKKLRNENEDLRKENKDLHEEMDNLIRNFGLIHLDENMKIAHYQNIDVNIRVHLSHHHLRAKRHNENKIEILKEKYKENKLRMARWAHNLDRPSGLTIRRDSRLLLEISRLCDENQRLNQDLEIVRRFGENTIANQNVQIRNLQNQVEIYSAELSERGKIFFTNLITYDYDDLEE
ncbi:13574_t:CDS:2 [Gigaspora rosea]|nr:13574_t:CDS:2 [Gigaspora rosea]